MRKVLFVCEYYPCASFASKFNELLAREISDKGSEVILLSDSWCKITSSNFIGDVNELSIPKPFTKRFYVDPIQSRRTYSNSLSCLYSIFCMIAENEEIDTVFYSGSWDNSLLISLIKSKYSIPCHLLLYDEPNIKCISDDYIKPYVEHILHQCEKVFTHIIYSDMLCELFHIDTAQIETSIPILSVCSENPNILALTNVFALCTEYSEKLEYSLVRLINSCSSGLKGHIAVFNNQSSRLRTKSKAGGSIEIILTDMHFSNVPKGSLVWFENEPSHLSINECLLALASGFFPIISQSNLRMLSQCFLLSTYGFGCPGFSALTAMLTRK